MTTSTSTIPAYLATEKCRRARDHYPHFWATQHEDTLIVFAGLLARGHEQHSIKARAGYAHHLHECISRVIEGIRDNGQRTKHDPQIIEILQSARTKLDPGGTKADNAHRAFAALHKIEKILADDIDACTCVTAPGCLCFGTYHIN